MLVWSCANCQGPITDHTKRPGLCAHSKLCLSTSPPPSLLQWPNSWLKGKLCTLTLCSVDFPMTDFLQHVNSLSPAPPPTLLPRQSRPSLPLSHAAAPAPRPGPNSGHERQTKPHCNTPHTPKHTANILDGYHCETCMYESAGMLYVIECLLFCISF